MKKRFMRVINYPTRGIGQTTVDKLVVAAKETGMSIFELLFSENRPFLKLNAGTSNRLENFATMIKSFQILAESADAFALTEHVIKKDRFST